MTPRANNLHNDNTQTLGPREKREGIIRGWSGRRQEERTLQKTINIDIPLAHQLLSSRFSVFLLHKNDCLHLWHFTRRTANTERERSLRQHELRDASATRHLLPQSIWLLSPVNEALIHSIYIQFLKTFTYILGSLTTVNICYRFSKVVCLITPSHFFEYDTGAWRND